MPNWFSSEYACRKLGGHLVIFNNTTQLQTAFDFLIKRTDKKPPCVNYWIGFTKSVWLFSKISPISNGKRLMLPAHFYDVIDDIQHVLRHVLRYFKQIWPKYCRNSLIHTCLSFTFNRDYTLYKSSVIMHCKILLAAAIKVEN